MIRARHWRDVTTWPYPHFAPAEMACHHCGRLEVDERLMDTLERQRIDGGRPIVVTSGYRCPVWNAMVGGAPLSQHKLGRAADQALRGGALPQIEAEARAAGFSGIGRAKTFVHVDIGPRRTWMYS